MNKIIRYFLENKLVTTLILGFFIIWGVVTAPFDWDAGFLPSDPVPVDAIPDIGENQQIVFTNWPGRSPQDVDDQITYPLTTALLGIPGVKDIRSNSMFGFSSIYIIFNEDIEFYWSRSRILEKLNSLPAGLLPEDVSPSLGPDATALGQIFWYTLEGRDRNGNPTGGWDPHELRTIQDFYVKYSLSGVEGVSEVASIGGYVKEYQVDIDPNTLLTYGITLEQVLNTVRNSNLDVGARTMEFNNVEYFIRGLGYIKDINDIKQNVVVSRDNIPITIGDIARVTIGPAERRGLLDKSGAEVAGGVVVARYGSNPLEVINNVKDKIALISQGLPQKTLEDGTVSQVTIVPFYDRTKLIKETLGTLEEALTLEILITILVIIIMVFNLRASVLIASLLPIAVLMTFIAMRYFGVDANIVALSGIAIAIGTMVDVGIIMSENMIRHMESKKKKNIPLIKKIYTASAEVAPAVVTAVATTVISFLPIFTMEAAEGKLFGPLAFTKTFALIAAVIVALFVLPAMAHWIFGFKTGKRRTRVILNLILLIAGIISLFILFWAGLVLIAFAVVNILSVYQYQYRDKFKTARIVIAVLAVTYLLTTEWLPLGAGFSVIFNFIFVALVIGIVLGIFRIFIILYPQILAWTLDNKRTFLIFPSAILIFGIVAWLGFNTVFAFVITGFNAIGVDIKSSKPWSTMAHTFPGVSKEFMPALDEGAFLLMPTTMPHAGIEKIKEQLKLLDMAVVAIPEVDMAVGKAGRVESALDPAPTSMFENVINYKDEYLSDESGKPVRFAVNDDGVFLRDSTGQLIPDDDGEYFRQWRDHIKSPDDIWNEIISATKLPGVTSAPRLQPIETRLIMLQTGMRAPIGIKVYGPDLKTIEDFALKLENVLKEVPSVKESAVFAERIVGKPYLQIDIDRRMIARYGLSIQMVQNTIAAAIGGMQVTTTVEGRERFPVRVRYARDFRDSPDMLKNIIVATPDGAQIPLGQLSSITYEQGPQSIKSENTFLVGYILLDKNTGFSEVDVVEDAQSYINELVESGRLAIPAGVSYKFAGNYENQVRASQRLALVIPLSIVIIFLLLFFQFKNVPTTLMIFSGIAVAFAGGFILIWLYSLGWFLNIDLFDVNLRDLFNINTINLSVAVWVGFLALFGIATDDGVVMATYLTQLFRKKNPITIPETRKMVTEAGVRRVRPCLMTTATTILALLPILTSTGRGSDIMIPMAIPIMGGMAVELVTLFVVPVLYSGWQESKLKKRPVYRRMNENI